MCGSVCVYTRVSPLPSDRGRPASGHAHTATDQTNGEIMATSWTGPEDVDLPLSTYRTKPRYIRDGERG